MTRRLARRPRAACQLPGVVDACLGFGAEAACVLCDMIDMDHPVTCRTTGRYPATDQVATVEDLFWAHLARRTDGGPRTAAALREKWDGTTRASRTLAWQAEHSPWRYVSNLPIEAPF